MARSSILAPHRLLIAGVVLLLVAFTLLFLRGPAFFQRFYYPLPAEYVGYVGASAERQQVNPYLLAAIIDAESDWQSDIVSPAGAVGLMQLLPSTAEDVGRNGDIDPDLADGALSDPAVNIEYGAAYLRYLIEHYHEVEPALAAYNAGMGNVDEWWEQGTDIREAIEFPETRHYVLRVVRAEDRYERLYPDAFPDWSE